MGVKGTYDPFRAYTASGTIVATANGGSLVSRDGCTYEPTSFGMQYVSTLAHGPDGAVFVALSEQAIGESPGDSKIYRSNDDGMTFPVSAEPGQLDDWWHSLMVAPSDPQRVYLTGYRRSPDGRTQLLFRSSDGGASYEPMTTSGLVFSVNTAAEVVGISATDPDVVYLKLDFQIDDTQTAEGIYRSDDAGQTWTNILQMPTPISFVARANGDLVAATQLMGTQVMRANSATWESVPIAPHINCLTENSAGELWACTANYDIQVERGMTISDSSDGAGIMKSTDLIVWTPVLRFEDILAPLPCAPGTVQHDTCQVKQWCILRSQVGIEPNPTCCQRSSEGDFVEDCIPEMAPSSGCCDANTGGAPTGVLIGLGGTLIMLRRRERSP